MKYQRSFNTNQNPFGSLMSLLMFVGVLILLFFLVKGFITILYWAAIPLFIITLIINHRVVANYASSIFETFQNDILFGIVKVLFTVLCYPIVIGWLFAKALVYRKVDKLKQEMQSQMKSFEQQKAQNTQYAEYTEYEDLTSKEEELLNKKIEMPKPKERDTKNPYDDIFGN